MDVIRQALLFVEKFFRGESSGHDYFHTLRVFRLATRIAEAEGADVRTVQLAALLHDVDDRKLSPETCETRANARKFLTEQQVDGNTVDAVCRIIACINIKTTPARNMPRRRDIRTEDSHV